MARRFVVRALVDELPLKIVSLVIAVTLFVVVRTDREASTGVYVKVIYTLPSDRVLVSDPISEVRVGVRGSWTRLARLEDRGIEPIRVDLKDVRDGALRFEDAMIKLPAGLRVASISPAEVQLKFEARAMREVAVEPVLEGQPADGFQLGVVSATPRTVRIEGPRSVIKGLSRIRTRPVGVKGARETVEADVELEAEPPHSRYLDVAQVAVRADIQPSIVERTFAVVPVMASTASADSPAGMPLVTAPLRNATPASTSGCWAWAAAARVSRARNADPAVRGSRVIGSRTSSLLGSCINPSYKGVMTKGRGDRPAPSRRPADAKPSPRRFGRPPPPARPRPSTRRGSRGPSPAW